MAPTFYKNEAGLFLFLCHRNVVLKMVSMVQSGEAFVRSLLWSRKSAASSILTDCRSPSSFKYALSLGYHFLSVHSYLKLALGYDVECVFPSTASRSSKIRQLPPNPSRLAVSKYLSTCHAEVR